jgi:CRP-like cAMP-binding protein
MFNFPLNKSRDCKSCESRTDSVFCSLPDEAIEILNNSKITNVFKKGQFVFYSGNFPSGLYCINSGVVRLESTGATGNNHILRVVRGGGILGYRSLFAEEAYEASAIVHEDAQICLIPKHAVLELLKKHPDVGLKFLSYVSKELKAAENRLCGQTDKNASERVAEALLFLKANFQDQNWTRREIAEWTGTTPETVMRTLSDFESEGYLELKGRKINIINRDALLEKANLVF